MTTDPQTRTGDGDVPVRATDIAEHCRLHADSLTHTAENSGLPARTAHSTPDTLDRKAAP